jgi:hypothetical protein
MDSGKLTGSPWVQAEYPDNTMRFFPQETRGIPTEAQAAAFYNYHAGRENPMIDEFLQQYQGASGREYPTQAPPSPRAFPQGPMNRGMMPPVTPRQPSQGASGREYPREGENYGRFPGAASNMGSTDMRANSTAMSLRPNDPISDILMRGGMPPAMR